jgi:multidrug efflux system membrane fusion protein
MTTQQDQVLRRTISRYMQGTAGKSVLIFLVLAAAIGGGAFYYQSHKPSTGADKRGDMKSRPFPVTTAPAAKRDMPVYLDALGTVASRNTVTVKTRVDGELVKLNFKEGQAVKKGDVLAEVDPRPYEFQLAQANAQLAKDKATLDNAVMDQERYRTLLTQDSIAKQQVDTQDALVRQLRAAVAVDQAQVDNAKLQLVYCRITSPIAGVVGLRQVDPGNQIHAADAAGIVTITQLQPITVLFPIPEDQLPGVIQRAKGHEAIHVEAYDRQKTTKLAEGALLTFDNQIDTTTGTVKLRAEFKNEDNVLFPNQFVNVRLLVDTLKDAVVIPISAVQQGQKGVSQVYVLKNDGTVELRPVVPGVTEGESVAIAKGLAVGEVVVVDGTDKLRDGAKVKPSTPGSSDAGKPSGHAKEGKHRHRGDA